MAWAHFEAGGGWRGRSQVKNHIMLNDHEEEDDEDDDEDDYDDDDEANDDGGNCRREAEKFSAQLKSFLRYEKSVWKSLFNFEKCDTSINIRKVASLCYPWLAETCPDWLNKNIYLAGMNTEFCKTIQTMQTLH